MAKMAELFIELNSNPEIADCWAECVKCGDEIFYSNEEEFAELVAKHIHTYRWLGVSHLTSAPSGCRPTTRPKNIYNGIVIIPEIVPFLLSNVSRVW